MTTPVTALRPPAWDLATPDLGVQTRFDITHVTYAAFDLVTAFGFYSGTPSVRAKDTVSDLLDRDITVTRWLHYVHRPALMYLLIPRITHDVRLRIAMDSPEPIFITHIDDHPMTGTDPTTREVATRALGPVAVTVTFAAAANLAAHMNTTALRAVPKEVQAPALAAGLTPNEIVTAYERGALGASDAQVLFALTEPAPQQ